MKFTDIPQLTRCGNWEADYPIVDFVKRIEEWELESGLKLNPDFQRGHVWTEEQQTAYVTFIYRGGLTGKTVYFNNPIWPSDHDDFVCVDGLQRITALKRFIHNEIKIYGCYFNEFTDTPRMHTWMKINVNNLKTRKEVLQWYLEFNSGGTPHTKNELDKVRKLLEKEG